MKRVVLFTIGLALCTSSARADAPGKKPVKPVDPAALAGRIDELLEKDWKAKGIQPAPLADDAEFLRRVYLDLAGRIPAAFEVRDFLASKHADKRQRVIDRLLDDPLYVNHLGTTWRSILMPPSNNPQAFYAAGFKAWLDRQVKENTPYDQLVRELLTAPVVLGANVRGAPPVNFNAASPVGFFIANELKPENVAASASRIFLGVKLECAQCHDHPFAKWKRDQFWQYAAFFSTMMQSPERDGRTPNKPGLGKEIRVPGTERTVQAKFLDGKKPEWQAGVESRAILADWMTSPQNPYFARTAVNRLWAHCFGPGIIDPVDDEPSEDSPISHPQLLGELTEQFIAHKYDLKFVLRAIVSSQAYQRTSAVSHKSQLEARTFARMPLKGLTPEQLFDSLAQATGYMEAGVVGPTGRGDPGNSPRAEFLNRFAGQHKRVENQTSILQALMFMNGKFIGDATMVSPASSDFRGKILDRGQTLSAVTEFPGWNTDQRIDALFLASLSRLPRAEERERFSAYVDRGGATKDRKQALGDVFLVLLNSSEFSVNH
ncbi:MAG: DUF1553 domain-containing protein [Planctomycetes bacterium]|nr:DUF1553 domain-containing protein [Planctomycetota bacterium]